MISRKMRTKKKHRLKWFEFRVGHYLIKNGSSDLFNEPIKIESRGHAKALWITQTKGHAYSELET